MDILQHYGTPRHSGRYPWGSGDNPYQRTGQFLKDVHELEKSGMSQKEIADHFGFKNTTVLRAKISIAKNNKYKDDLAYITKLKDHGYSTAEISRRTGLPESTIRSMLKPSTIERSKLTDATISALKANVDAKNFIDVGLGTEFQLGVSRDKLKKSLVQLKEEGYQVVELQVEQLGTGEKTKMQILAGPGTNETELKRYLYNHLDEIGNIENKVDPDAPEQRPYLFDKDHPPVSIDSSRIDICYAENGGDKKDGVIELRRGVEDISLGDSQYAQVRIAVDGTHYLKGMAMYSDNLPDGIDIRFNTNKHEGTPMLGDKDNSVLKPLKSDPENPFGASIKQFGGKRTYLDISGNEVESPVYKVNDEGDWDKWSKTLASQMLSKQPLGLVKQQLKLTYAEKEAEYNDILSVTNPVIKRKLLQEFADDCDASAVDLKASALPRQKFQVILPITSLKDDEIYAQNFKDGEKVVLIRYPHGGKFEIPELTVNNKNAEALSVLRNAADVVGINSNVAARLSGADFDGDTVLVIPNNSGAVKTSPPLAGLKDFDPKELYKLPDSAPRMSNSLKQNEMGKISNLITDMTIKGAPNSEIERAVKHSMVVIDAEKHHLDYKKSYEDNNIAELKLRYQGATNAGASTLISKAGSVKRVPERGGSKNVEITDPKTGEKSYKYANGNYRIDPETGKKIFNKTGRTYTTHEYTYKDENGDRKTRKVFLDNKTGQFFYKVKGGKIDILTPEQAAKVKTKTEHATTKSTKMYETEDAFELSSGSPVENAYASYANKVKALANTARKELISVKDIPYSSSAKKAYDTEVRSLVDKLNEALSNKPYERQAQRVANSIVKSKRRDNPDMTGEELKKLKGQQLVSARVKVGAKKKTIDISPKEWEAIQAGAVTPNRLKQIVDNANKDTLKQLATPRSYNSMSDTKKAVAQTLAASGWTQADIAERLGVSTSAVSNALKDTPRN